MIISSDNFSLNKTIAVNIVDADNDIDCIVALVDSVHEIVKTYPAPFTLFVSGGVDSQAMVYAWLKAGVEFDICHVDYVGFNDHDFQEMQNFCNLLSLPLEKIQFDVVDFLENRLDKFAESFKCASPQICTHMAFSELKVGTRVFAGNLPTQNSLSIDNTIFGLQRYATLSGQDIIPFFLMSSEAACRASIAKSTKLTHAAETYDMKCEHYRKLGFPILPQSKKFTGFEKLKEHYDLFPRRVSSKDKMKHAHLPSKRVFDHLFRNKYLIKFNNHFTPFYRITDSRT